MSEILPTWPPLIVAIFLGASLYAILTAAGLQFLGLGNAKTVCWGTMLYWAQNNEAFQVGSRLGDLPGRGIAVLGAAFGF